MQKPLGNCSMTHDSESKTYFTVSMFYQSRINGMIHESNLWEEQIVLVRAFSEEDAAKQAINFASTQETSYKNSEGEDVEWRFFKIERIFNTGLAELSGNAEIFSRFLRSSEAESLLTPFD